MTSKVKIVSDGTKEGTKVFMDGMEMTTSHWESLTWEYNFVLEKWTMRIEHLPLPEWGVSRPSYWEGYPGVEAEIDLGLDVRLDNHKE